MGDSYRNTVGWGRLALVCLLGLGVGCEGADPVGPDAGPGAEPDDAATGGLLDLGTGDPFGVDPLDADENGAVLVFEGGEPVWYCGAERATIVGTDAQDVIEGTEEADVVVALGGNDIVFTNGGNDVVCTGPGDDIVDLGEGDDLAFLGDGNDFVHAHSGHDRLYGGAGDDEIDACSGDDVLSGGSGDDYLDGGPWTDVALDGEVIVNVP